MYTESLPVITSSKRKPRPLARELHKLVRLGYERPNEATQLGFHQCIAPTTEELAKQAAAALTDIQISDELPVLTFAPIGSGKGTGAVIPTLLTNPRSTIVLDPKGENFAVTARRRIEMGHKVYALDPFNIMTKDSAALNPLDLLQLPDVCVESEAVTLAAAIGHDYQSKRESFWDQHALGLMSGLVALAASGHYPPNLTTVRDHLVGQDPIGKIYEALNLLSSKNECGSMAYRELAAFLHQSERETRPSVLASAGAYAKIFNSDRVMLSLQKSTMKLKDVISGKPLTVYMIIPSSKLYSHRALLRLWLTTIIIAIQSRKVRPAESTLLLIDECAQLGKFELLQTVVTLCRGYGVQPWLFFQSLFQLKENYGESWRTFVDNAGAIQAFGFANMFGVEEWGKFFGRTPDQLLSMSPQDQLLYISGKGTLESRRMNYLVDAEFKGMFDENPYFANQPYGERN